MRGRSPATFEEFEPRRARAGAAARTACGSASGPTTPPGDVHERFLGKRKRGRGHHQFFGIAALYTGPGSKAREIGVMARLAERPASGVRGLAQTRDSSLKRVHSSPTP